MSNLLEITGDDVARLGDADLRVLIGLLCEADYRFAGLPTIGITWGGHQDARDGGLDVVVRGKASPPINSFIPRNNTGFQVKKSDMPRAEILKEMRPKGVLRDSIKALIQENGAYIIASSDGSTTDTALKNRIKAMEEAVSQEKNKQDLHLDFLDRGRVATWIRSHPSLILWVRNKIGRPIKGWLPYENWANSPGGLEEEYLLDDGLRLHSGNKPADKGLSGKESLHKLRTALATPGISVRLTGLSGVGKTRFVQALFDQRVGEDALNSYQAVYSDMSDSPSPDPNTLAKQLISENARAIIIVDNCPPDLHRRLTQTCSKQKSTVSLITVEYDIRDDLPEETSVFRLEAASEELIYKLIRKRFPHISQVDAQTIAKFSGGNARIAIMLANTVEQGDTLSGFRDEELFKRLFWQRNSPNESLLVSAEACSLVYSFEGMDASSEKSELQFLATLVGKPGADLYRDVVDLKKRGLIQSRSVWRAVLPHAIANRLAKRALESIAKDTLVQAFLNASDRLIKSFTRRLNYLHDCLPAIKITDEWLAHDGWLGKENCNFNDVGMEIFRNIAPVSPVKSLEAIERAANGDKGQQFTSRVNTHFYEFVLLLRHLAYDPTLFNRSVNLLCRYALSESSDENNNSTRDILKSLFYLHLSGTHATVEARAKIIKGLIDSQDQDKQNLGFFLLEATLEAWHFSSSRGFGFGARPRDYGYGPKTKGELTKWFNTFIGICTCLALSRQSIAEQARKLLANKLRGLWTKGAMYDALEEAAGKIQDQRAWNEGWIAVREIIQYDGEGFKEEIWKRLCQLENALKPIDLLEKARTFALSDQHQIISLEDDFEAGAASDGLGRIKETTRKIGAQVAQSADTFKVLLPDLVSTNSPGIESFGNGLADGCSDKQEFFQILIAEFKRTPPEKRRIGVILGFLSSYAESDSSFYNTTLDSLVRDDVLGEWFLCIQCSSTLDQRAVARLHLALHLGKAPIRTFQSLGWRRTHESISDEELARLLTKISSRDKGVGVAIDIIVMRFYGRNEESPEISDSLMRVGQDLLSIYPFEQESSRQDNRDHDLEVIARICLNGQAGVDTTTKIGQHFTKGIMDHRLYPFNYPRLLNSLAQVQPIVFLNMFLGNTDIEDYQRRRLFSDSFEGYGNPLDHISDDELLSWCENDAVVRYQLLLSVVEVFKESDETGKLEWTPIADTILERAPDLGSALERLASAIIPMSWSGSRADIMKRRLVLFPKLFEHGNTEISSWAKNQHSNLQEKIRNELKFEHSDERERYERERNESFE